MPFFSKIKGLFAKSSESSLSKKARVLISESKKTRKELNDLKDSISHLEHEIGVVLDRAKESVLEANDKVKQMESGMDALNEKLKIAEEVTIPGLISANQVLLDRFDAESAIEIARAVAVGSSHSRPE